MTMHDPRFPEAVEVRVPGRPTRRTFLDWSALPDSVSIDALISTAIEWLANEEGVLVSEAILEGHNLVETQVQGQPTIVHHVPSWWHPVKRCRVEVMRYRHRHPDATERWWFALQCLGAPWGLIDGRTR